MSYPTACGGVINLTDYARDHLKAHPEVMDLLSEAIGKISLPSPQPNGLRPKIVTQIDMGRVVGLSSCVSTGLIGIDEDAWFAKRLNRDKASRVALETRGDESRFVVIIAVPAIDSTYELITAWIGELAPKEPWDPTLATDAEFKNSLDFWCRSALVYNAAVMEPPFKSTWAEVLGKSA